MPEDRLIRTLINTKQSSLEYSGKPAINSMVDGQTAIERKPNGQLALYKKKFGKLWKSFMSDNGDQYVERDLNVTGNLTVNKNFYQGYNTMKIFPTDFVPNDDSARPLQVVDNGGSIIANHADLEAYASYEIPRGHTAISFYLYGSDTNNAVAAYKGSIDSATTASLGTGTIGGEVSINVASTSTQYLIIYWAPTATDDALYGGYIGLKKH